VDWFAHRTAQQQPMMIYDEVLAFIHAPEQASFKSLALDVFRHQFDTVAPYREYCLTRETRPDEVRSLDQIPSLSTAAFKYAELTDAVTPSPPGDARVFMTSGTTAGRDERGRHHMPRLDIYRASALGHLRTMLFPDGARTRMLSLHPTADRMPESSLAQMISWMIEEFGAGDTLCAADRKGVEIGLALEFLRSAERQCEPVCVMATTAALGALFEDLRTRHARLSLAPGSRLMDTGGAKGQTVPLGSGQVVEQAQALFGLDPAMVINEYGMTEMCSQLYDTTSFNARNGRSSRRGKPPEENPRERYADRRKLGPAWLDVAAVDPSSLKRVPDGTPGLLRFFDLANVGSVSAILTGDVGVIQDRTVRVLGRAEDGEARGCALGMEQFAARES
jgi:Acyl-protein synthetase, LuxE